MNDPKPPPAWSTSRSAFISAWRHINTSLDVVFYDTPALSDAERAELESHIEPQGKILVVHPRSANKKIRWFTPLQFVNDQRAARGEAVGTIVVAGVGSSALGTACLARDAADYLGEPVAGIVSGLGLADVGSEAAGGWFVFGFNNALRDMLARMLSVFVEDHVRDQRSHDDMKKHFSKNGLDPECFVYGSPDSTALLYVLSKLGSRIKLLIGHSKGNYSIENALEGLHQMCERSGKAIPDFQIVTLGAVIWFGNEFTRVCQLIGQVDLFGMMNSRPEIDCTRIPGEWHSLNRQWPGHMPVSQALELAKIPAATHLRGPKIEKIKASRLSQFIPPGSPAMSRPPRLRTSRRTPTNTLRVFSKPSAAN